MTKKQLYKQLSMAHRDLTKAECRMQKIAEALDIDRHEYLAKTLYEVEELLKMFEDNGPQKTH